MEATMPTAEATGNGTTCSDEILYSLFMALKAMEKNDLKEMDRLAARIAVLDGRIPLEQKRELAASLTKPSGHLFQAVYPKVFSFENLKKLWPGIDHLEAKPENLCLVLK
jgi:hypothetical protein